MNGDYGLKDIDLQIFLLGHSDQYRSFFKEWYKFKFCGTVYSIMETLLWPFNLGRNSKNKSFAVCALSACLESSQLHLKVVFGCCRPCLDDRLYGKDANGAGSFLVVKAIELISLLISKQKATGTAL